MVFSCEKKPEEIAVSSVSLNQPTAEMIIGETVQLQVSISPSNATDKNIIWGSSKQSVATVSSSGLVSAISEGNSTVTATVGGKSATCQVTVSKGIVDVSSITLNITNLELIEGDSETLIATVKPDDATDKTVAWSTSNAQIATVDKAGNVTAIKEGFTSITAKAGDKTALCTVLVRQKLVSVESVELNKSSVEIVEGDTFKLIASVKPENATDKTVTWNSSEPETVSVSSEGILTAIKPGNATVTVTTNDGNFTATCSVTVFYKPKASALFLEGGRWLFAAEIGQHFSLSVTTEPEDCHLELEWTVSDASIATISGEGRSVDLYTTDYGEAVVTVKDRYSGLSLSESVETRVRDFYWTENTGLQHDGVPMVEITIGEEYQLHCHYSPEYATRIFRKDMAGFSYNGFVHTSPTFFTIDDNGLIKGVSSGLTLIETRIPVYKREGSSSLYVNVISQTVPIESIELSKASVELNVGESETLIATVKPDNATDKTVTWSSSAAEIASVDQNGKVTAIKEGTATITAKAGGKEASCEITVDKKVIQVTSITLDKEELTVFVGNQATLTATVKPDDATDKTVTWTSSNTSAATVENGVIKGVGTGRTTITATAGNQSATCSVLVVKNSADGVYAQYYGGAMSIINGKIQSGSQLNFGVVNYSSETIRVVSVQLIDGQTGNGGNVMSIGADIVSGSSSTWTITIGGAGIYEPTARFIYTFKGGTYTCEAKYTAPNWGF